MSRLKKGLALVLTLCMMLSLLPVITPNAEAALTMGTKPADGTTTGNPFVQGTGGSNSFRIPAMVTLNDGTIVAAADARWNTTYDGGGLDTIVSYSTDNGATWNYTFANYLGDNGNTYNGSGSTAFIDPALATDGKTVYMLCDLYPYGVALNGSGNTAPSTAVGFNDDGTLKLAANGSSDYSFYLKDGQIYNSSNEVVSGYTVDAYFNITGNGYDTNLFFSDSPYQVVRTGYLYLTKSTDGGKNWSAPTLIPNVKTSSEQVCLVGPGRGLVTGGKIIFPVYSYNGDSSSQQMGFIYSSDRGVTWTRSANFTGNSWSSESAVVELTDGTLRFFYRNGNSKLYYADYNVSNDSWGSAVDTGIATNSNTQLSAISYSKTVDGKQVILVSCPTGSNSAGSADSSANARLNGKIFVGYVNNNKTMSWQSDKAISVTSNNSQFMYSCLTELSDGKVAILYENQESAWGTGDNYYYTMDFQTYDLDLTSGGNGDTGGITSAPSKTKDIVLTVGESKEVKDETGNYQNAEGNTTPDTKIATVEVKGTPAQEGGVKYTEASVTCDTLISSDKSNWTAVSGYYYTPDGSNYYPVYAKRSSSWSWSSWSYTYTYTWGYSTTSSANNVQQIDTQSTTDTSTPPNITVYTESTTDPVPASTTITFTGVSAGTTSVVVGNTKYNITVNRKTKDVSLSVGGTATYTDTGTPVVADKTVASATLSGDTLTITGLKEGTTTVTTDTTVYNVTVKEVPPVVDMETTPFISGTGDYGGNKVTKLTTSVNKRYDLNLNISGSSITWSSADGSIATVDQNGTITGKSAGETTVTCTIDRVAYTIPVVVLSDSYGGSYDYTCDLYIAEITSTTVQYSINLDTNLLDAQEGEAIYLGFDYPFCINFFGMQDKGYALTFMNATDTKNQYYPLYKVTDVTTLDAYKAGAMHWQAVEMANGEDRVQALLRSVTEAGYNGTTGFTRTQNNENISSSLSFRSAKLPTVTKEVATVNGVAYTEGMVAHAEDEVVFKVTVTQYAAKDDVTYSSVTLKDNLDGAVFAGSNSSTKTITNLSNTAVSKDTTHTYQVEYTIKDADLDTTIHNTVDLTYTYKSAYSSGSFGGTANADAKFTAASFNPQDIVIDFGLPVTIDYSGTDAHGRYDLSSGTATYGTVTVSENKVTYTPNTVLRGIDTVTLTNTAGGTYTFKVYPATTVYYEEGFASNLGNFKGTGTQTASKAGDQANYGYDAAYTGATYQSQTGTKPNGTATFAFTGTGVDIYTYNYEKTGSLMIKVKKDGTLKKMIAVDTQLKPGLSNSTAVPSQAYNVPVASITGLEYGNYTIELTNVKSGSEGLKDVFIDGFRVYGTLQDQSNSVYTADLEDNPTFIEMRDQVLAGLSVTSTGSGQVNAALPEDTTVAVVASSEKYTQENVDDLLKNGPKNEIYLQPDQALVLKITTNREVQIGLKALNTTTTYTITGKNGNQTLSTSTDMFYTVLKNGSSGEQTITITNTGAGILSITKLKICDDPNATLGTLTAGDLIPALVSLGFETTPDESGGSSGGGGGGNTPAEPTEPTEPTTPPTGIGLPFTDVGPGDWFLENVKYVYEKGLMNGTSDTTFSPKQTTNRAMIVTILHRLENSPAVDAQSPFADVAADQYYANPVAWAAANGIVNGISKTSFAPLNNITREQMAAILYRYAQFKDYDVSVGEDTNILSYADAETISEYAVPAMQWAVGSGLINGKGGGVLDPQGSATRAEVSAILARFCEAYAK